MVDFNLLFFIVFLNYLWFDTDAFVEYAAILRLKFAKYEPYFQLRKTMPMDYHSFLLSFHNSFIVRLITCPVCFLVWLNLAGALFSNDFMSLGLTTILSWLGYFGLRKTIKRLNE